MLFGVPFQFATGVIITSSRPLTERIQLMTLIKSRDEAFPLRECKIDYQKVMSSESENLSSGSTLSPVHPGCGWLVTINTFPN